MILARQRSDLFERNYLIPATITDRHNNKKETFIEIPEWVTAYDCLDDDSKYIIFLPLKGIVELDSIDLEFK